MNYEQYPSTSPPPPYSNSVGFNSLPQTNDERMSKFQHLVNRYEINREFATRLRGLEGYEIVFIVDDSGSMNTPLGDITGPFDQNPTRWDELRQTVSIVVDIASVFDPDGVDIFFLNRESKRGVKSAEELIPVFSVPPAGPTPIALQERKLLVLIATDGIPTNEAGQQDIKTLEHVLRHERTPINRIPVTIIACTDDDECVGWDKKIPNLDVADDYRSERTEIHNAQGKDFPFSFGDYVVKVLMGAVDDWFDTLDERRVTGSGPPKRHGRKDKKRNTCCIS
ncbi:hypothetical protein I4U23_002253 [Adineta vaga]|nr:hypothetical protein I4U23_002253 [Adineta vaga]